jgi:hypothetical protein
VDITRPWGVVLPIVDLQATTDCDLHMPTKGRAVVDDAQTRLVFKEEILSNDRRGMGNDTVQIDVRDAAQDDFYTRLWPIHQTKRSQRREDWQDGPRRRFGDICRDP